MKLFIRIILLVSVLPAISYAEEKVKHETLSNVSGVEVLSHDLRLLLSQEMRALQSGMMSIIPAYVSGNWNEIEKTARKIKNSYLLKQNLTEGQAKELHTVLPHEFIEKDQSFHNLAGMLEHAAKNKKPERMSFYFSKMNEACVNCHMIFATHRFPALIPKLEEK